MKPQNRDNGSKLRVIMLGELIPQLCPPIEINYNWAGSTDRKKYEQEFASLYVEHFFPYLLRQVRSYHIQPANIRLLDIGCGFAPLAFAFVIFKSSVPGVDGEGIQYLGIDIREDAITWLQKAYDKYDYVQFLYHRANQQADYIGEGNTTARECVLKARTTAASCGQETAYRIPESFFCNLQWSSSVFTHLTPQACVTALQTIARCSTQRCLQVNTWFIIDEESRYSLAAGIADRQLPIDCGQFLTYCEENPLVCTCYKLDVLQEMYDAAGLDIVEIDRGSWRGKAYRNCANHYQDVVVSVPKQRPSSNVLI